MASEPKQMTLANVPNTSKIRNFRYLSLQGGGMKGIGFGGAVEALESTGVLSQIEAVAGSSAGAIVATLIAVGYTAKEIREIMLNLDFRDLQDKDSPGWIESSGIKDLFQEGAHLLTAVDKLNVLNKVPIIKKAVNLPGKIMGGLEGIEDIAGLAMGNELGLWKGEALLNIVSSLIIRKTGKPNLTFRELEKLTADNPGVFRNLILTGSNLNEKSLEYYNAKDWPDMPIIDAVRISASFPGGFKPVAKPIVKEIRPDGAVITSTAARVDGGLLENLPDIFNKPPYYRPTQNEAGNPECLAISFKEKQEFRKKIKSGADLVAALYSTVMSEKELQEKYRNNIAFIDPQGVGTLDFDADRTRTNALADSGRLAVEFCFQGILAVEGVTKPNFKGMNLPLLVRQEVALMHLYNQAQRENRTSSELQKIVNDLIVVQDLIGKKTKGVSGNSDGEIAVLNDISILRKKEKARLRAIEASIHGVSLTDKELIDSCYRKIEELSNTEIEIEVRLRQLELVKTGLEFRGAELEARFSNTTGTDSFSQHLKDLNGIQNEIRNTRQTIAALDTSLKYFSNNTDTSKSTWQIKKWEKQYQQLLRSKEEAFNRIIKDYYGKNDILMQHYFEELKHESDDVFFNMPMNAEEARDFLLKDLNVCENYIADAHKEKEAIKVESKIFKERLKGFENRTLSAEQYSALKETKNELEKSIYKKTGFIAKISNYLTKKWPSHKNSILTVMSVCNLFAFGIKAMATLPFAIIIRAIQVFSKNPKVKNLAERIYGVFKLPNLFKLGKLKELSKISAQLFNVLDANYKASADKSEQTYLFRLFTEYLKNSGLSFDDIFSRKKLESSLDYKNRIEQFQKKLEKTDPKNRVLMDTSTPLNDNMRKLRERVLAEIEKPAFGSKQLQGKKRTSTFLKGLILQQNINQARDEFIKKIHQKINNKEPIKMDEAYEYIKNALAIDLKIPKRIQEQFLGYIREKVKTTKDLKALSRDEMVLYVELTNNPKNLEEDQLRKQILNECKEFLPADQPTNRVEANQALDIFFQMRKEQRGGLKKQPTDSAMNPKLNPTHGKNKKH